MSVIDSIQSFPDNVRARLRRSRQIARTRSQDEILSGVFFSLPFVVKMGLFLLLPTIYGLYLSVYHWNPIVPSESEFIGLQNYIEILTGPEFWNSMRATIYYVALNVPANVIFPLLLALALNRKIKGRSVLRPLFFSPFILTVSVAMLAWIQLYSSYGPINAYLSLFMDNPPSWLNEKATAMPAVVLANLWWTFGFQFVILFAARRNVDERLYEAARLDGAYSWNAFKDITLPQMRNAIVFVVFITLVNSFQVFGQPWILTQGGPGQATQTMVIHLYSAAFLDHQYGYAAAIGFILMVVMMAISGINAYIVSRWLK